MDATLTTPGQHVLIVEDDDGIRTLISTLLRENGFRVTGCRNGHEMRHLTREVTYDLVILDVMLPGGSGLDLCRMLRETSGVPIIMVTARADEVDRVVGLEIGADDYVTKPFGRAELLARIRAVLRRGAHPVGRRERQTDVLRFSGWELRTASRELVDPSGAAVDLSGAEYELLLTFLEHPGRVLSRDRILEMSRGRLAGAADRSVDVLVSRLRRKIDHSANEQGMIKTVRGAGYIFVGRREA
ncbi:response regulator transcription factor [Methylobacterium sp. Leaf108]|uniref:response regulator n=1 Tax=Methylobacterium sp. Leaf108 TaxID=1736256 RepID=UPI0006FC54D3|nr:response regulator transcription factor [Methylobacterium sp. Leaf108]KQP61612.1 hypothetical protein ASF39_02775 [Methylobacterium sp. Leaf108]